MDTVICPGFVELVFWNPPSVSEEEATECRNGDHVSFLGQGRSMLW